MVATNKQLLKKICEEFVKGNLEFSLPYMTDDIKWNILGTDPVVGKEQLIEAFKMDQLQSFPVVTIKNVLSEGDYVVTESIGQAMTKSGKPYNQTYCEVFKFENEKLQEITTYLDTALSKEVLADD